MSDDTLTERWKDIFRRHAKKTGELVEREEREVFGKTMIESVRNSEK